MPCDDILLVGGWPRTLQPLPRERLVLGMFVVFNMVTSALLQCMAPSPRSPGEHREKRRESTPSLFPRSHPPATVSTLAPPHDPVAPRGTGVDHPEMPTAAVPTAKATVVLLRVSHRYRLLCCRSDSLIRRAFRACSASTPSFAPLIDAATAQPTRQSSQWLSGADGFNRHS